MEFKKNRSIVKRAEYVRLKKDNNLNDRVKRRVDI